MKKAFLFGLYVYISSFFLYGLLSFLPQFEQEIFSYTINWLITIPLILFWCRWYFRSVKPSFKEGLRIGLMAIMVGLLVDVSFLLLLVAKKESTTIFSHVYEDWKFYVSLAEVLLITIGAGVYGQKYMKQVPVKTKKFASKKKTSKKNLTKSKK